MKRLRKRFAGVKGWKRCRVVWTGILFEQKVVSVCAPICAGCSVQWSARTAGSWRKPLENEPPIVERQLRLTSCSNLIVAGHPHRIQHLLGRAHWSADQVRDDLLGYVREQLVDEEGILVIDETGFLKKGNKSVGVARQYSGTAGRIENSQIGVFAAYVSPSHGGARTLVDRALYLPKAWTEDPQRCRAAGVPEEVGFATKLQLARGMVGLPP